jgi:anti-sigma B factor antagonist
MQTSPGVQMNPSFTIDVVNRADAVRLALAGELDLATAPLLSQRLTEVEADATVTQLVVIDLTGVPFIDSTGLRVLLEAHARSQGNGNRLRITGGSDQARKLFALAGVLDKLPFLAPDGDAGSA